MPLSKEQRQRALEVMQEYLDAAQINDGKTPVVRSIEWDSERVKVIESQIKPLLSEYLNGSIPLSDFKSRIDSINKRHSLWGFRGIKGQMFFNLVVNVSDDINECDQELKVALASPDNVQIASSRIKTFGSYVKRVGEQWVEAGNTRHGCPKVGSIPFFLSYFWQIQNRDVWPVYYTNSVQTMSDLNLWQESGELAEDYVTYKQIHEELAEIFSKASGKHFGLYEVEHVFWYKGRMSLENIKGDGEVGSKTEGRAATASTITVQAGLLPDSFVPAVIEILPKMARYDEVLTSTAKRSGTTLARAFEKSIDAAFTMLGYETKLLGQGQGRVPDGLAVDLDNSYAIIWDAKARSDRYSMGTDDRTIREYIVTQSRELKRKRGLRNVYYLIISSEFADDFDDPVRSLKMETDISEVILVQADALVAMVDAKLRAPRHVSLGPDGLQRLFTNSGVLTAEDVRELIL